MLSVVIYTGAVWTTTTGAVALDATIVPMIQLKSSITAEGDTANIVVYAEFDDGHYEDVTSEVTISMSDGSGSLDFFSPTQLQVQPVAVAIWKPTIKASLNLCNVTVAEGVGVIMLDLPEATSVTITGKPKVTKADDGATYSPFDVSSSIEFVVTMYFDDGSHQDYSSDFRTRFTISEGSGDLVQLNGNMITVVDDAIIKSDSSVSIAVSFPGYFTVSAETSISDVEFISLEATTVPWPAQANYEGNVRFLRAFGCSGIFQRLEARATGTLSDGTQSSDYAFYRQVKFVSNATDTAAFTLDPA